MLVLFYVLALKKKKNTLVSVTKQDRKSEALPLRAAYI